MFALAFFSKAVKIRNIDLSNNVESQSERRLCMMDQNPYTSMLEMFMHPVFLVKDGIITDVKSLKSAPESVSV